MMLLILAILFAGANVWYSAARSTVPLELNDVLTAKDRLLEKIPGVDDVYLLNFESGQHIHVDRHVFDAVDIHQRLSKHRLDHRLQIDDHEIVLSMSSDFYGMVWVMPMTVLICITVGLTAIRTYP